MKKYLVEYEYNIGHNTHVDREEVLANSAEEARKKLKTKYYNEVYPIFSVAIVDE